MKVLFVFFTDPPSPFSSSVAALAPIVRSEGHQPVALSIPRTASIDTTVETVRGHEADVIGISCMTRDWPGARALLERLGDTGAYRIVGGYHASLGPRDVARCDALDAVVIGEGERPLAALLRALERGERPATMPGLWARSADGFTDPIPPADSEPDIADLPFWDYEVFGDMAAHLREGINTFGPHADRTLPVRASRGCPYTCAYCSAPQWGALGGFRAGERRNRRPVAHLTEELAQLRDRYAPEGFEFWDEHFPLDLDWLRELARELPRRVGLPFKVEMHPRAASRERLALLKEAGCMLFHCGVEAGDPELRREVLRRRTTDAQLQQVFDDCRELGLRASASLMTSLPHETRPMAHATVQLLRKLRPDSFMWSNYQPLPGTALGEAVVEAWPGAARGRFDAIDPPRLREAIPVNEEERRATFRELRTLQLELVEAAGDDRARPVDVPEAGEASVPATPVDGSVLARKLALDPDQVVHAELREGTLRLRLRGDGFEERTITLAPRGRGPAFTESRHLALAYQGKEPEPALLEALRALAARLGDATFEDFSEAGAR